MKLLLASNNAKKLRELEAILTAHGVGDVEVVQPADVGGLAEVDEDRDTFLGNAEKKALAAAAATGLWSLADDSGLCVDALDGAPGVYSARYAGEPSDDRANNRKLLQALADVPDGNRGARFVCALVLGSPDGRNLAEFTGEVRGRIVHEPRGTSGFGYDPLFELIEDAPGRGRTFAELSDEEKAAVSHRGRAFRELAARLPGLLASHEPGGAPRA